MATRHRILAAGLELFAKDGYHHTSSKKIAAAAGVATGTFYNHFKDKKALLLALHRDHVIAVHEEIERFFNQSASIASPPDSRQMMRELVELILRTHQFGPELHRELHILSFTDDDFATSMRKERENSHGKLRQALLPFRNRIRVDDFETANLLVGMVVETVVHSIVMGISPLDADRLLPALTDMLHRYLFN
ncbi:MAG: TetR/AcrR family transcriptional regulator [Deltaproteobacteria bacterium]|nr:TetR/AcrR family transcriptional regulator [Deltaproteobacteria bacterium]